ncbi:MAG: hypothetical protein ACRDNK_16380 [Solirubrobacteraceae bacterium]
MRRDTLIGTVALTLALVGCGGASGASSPPQASATRQASAPPQASATRQASAAPSTTRATRAADSSPTATAGTATTANAAPRLPARFKVGAGGRLSPPVIAAPGHTDIEVSFRCTDHHVHRVVLATPHRHAFTVSRSSTADVLLIGLHNGTYGIKVDGKPRGKLLVGAAPGP